MQNAGTEVVDAKAGAGSATLSMAYAAYLFVTACLKAMNGFAGVVECAYVEDASIEGCDFFAQRVKLGKTGILKRYALTCTSSHAMDLRTSRQLCLHTSCIHEGADGSQLVTSCTVKESFQKILNSMSVPHGSPPVPRINWCFMSSCECLFRYGVGKLSEFESAAVEDMKPQLAAEIAKGNEWSK
jgi:hypothetical protein